MLCGLVGLPLMASIPESADAAAPDTIRAPYLKLLASPLKDGNFRKVLGFYAYWNLAVNVSAPFFAVFMLEKLHLPFWYVTVLCTLSSVSGLLANRFWTRLSEKFGHRPIIFLATLGDALYPLWWLFLTPQTAWLLLPIHCSGLFGAPLAVGPNNMVFKLSPARNASPYMAVFNAVIGPTTAAAAILGGWLAATCGRWEFSISGASFGGLHLLFMISCVGRLTSLILLWRVTEPRSHEIGRVVRILQRRFARKPSALAAVMLGWRGVMTAPSRLALAGGTLVSTGHASATSLAKDAVPTANSIGASLSTDETPASLGSMGPFRSQAALADPLAA
jgi:MFS-type transporter involved in bile tolerance (Atg22 family)